ncbi:hypothetical protein L7F22_022211 [Adiantum nelumboides]|nr:hypothetical protein [Adiantum nelumboides]
MHLMHKPAKIAIRATEESFGRFQTHDAIADETQSDEELKWNIEDIDPNCLDVDEVDDMMPIIDAEDEMFGTPLEIIFDRGPGFMGDLVGELMEQLGISRQHSSPYYPQCNGLVEKMNGKIEDVAGLAAWMAIVRAILPIVEQAHWDVKDAQAHALNVLSIKHTITPHIRSAKFAKQAWDILASHYSRCNEATIALLHKEQESKIMNEEDDMDAFFDGVKDVNEQLIFASEAISDTSLVQIVLDALPDLYQTFASTWSLYLLMKHKIQKIGWLPCN